MFLSIYFVFSGLSCGMWHLSWHAHLVSHGMWLHIGNKQMFVNIGDTKVML